MMKRCFIITIILIWFVLKADANSIIVSDLKPIRRYVYLENHTEVLLYREFKMNGESRFLGADSTSLKTSILKPEEILNAEAPFEFEKTKLYRILQAKEPIKFITTSVGYILTVDLCEKPRKQENKFEEELFNFLINVAKTRNIAIPVGFAVSGVWILQEPEYFKKIVNARKERMLDVVWINHSMTHPVLQGKFLTASAVNFENEVLKFEALLLQSGETPSLFFRFPGLVYNEDLLYNLANLSLIPIDSNAWLAKGQKPKSGSIILVHGNGNEPKGVDILFKILKKEAPHFVSLYSIN